MKPENASNDPIPAFPSTFAERINTRVTWLAAIIIAGVAALQYFIGTEVSLFIFYGFPVGLLIWKGKKTAAHLFAIVASLVWLILAIHSQFHFSQPWIPYWNAIARLIFFQFEIIILSRLRRQMVLSQRKVASLQSLLHICNSCYRIKDHADYWNELPDYIEDHFSVEVTRKLCPECSKRRYHQAYISSGETTDSQ